MAKEVEIENGLLKEKALDTYYTDRLNEMTNTLNRWHACMKNVRSWADHDDYAISSNHLIEKRIALAFEAAQKLSNPVYKEKFYRECLNAAISYYEVDPPPSAFKFLHPRVSRMFRRACEEYEQAAKELIESKKYDSETQLKLMNHIVFYEEVVRKLSFSRARRS